MNRMIPLVLGFIMLAACTPSKPSTVESGVAGRVRIGPLCPVVRLDQPCPDRLYQATLTVLNLAGKKIAQIQTDSDGLYQLKLLPGEYTLQPESPDVIVHAQAQSFTVLEGRYTMLDILFDSGIR